MPFTGEWYHQNRPPILKAGGAVTADVEQADLAACAVATAAVAARSVTSEKASTNLLTRSYLAVIEPPEPNGLTLGGSSIGGWSSAYAIWRPLVPVTVARIQAFVLREYEHACNDSLTLYGNSGTCIGDVRFCGQSTAMAGGTRVAGGNLNLVALPACTNVTVKATYSTCSIAAPVAVQIDYTTTD